MRLETLPDWASDLIATERVARLAYLDDDERPRVLPVTFAVAGGAVWSAIDEKPKRSPEPARVAYLRRRPEASLLVDRYDDDWSRLAWVQLIGSTLVVDARGRDDVVAALAVRYPHYRDQPPPGPLLRFTPERAVWWRAAESG
jgi:PPOX class probable F420-dependent enzyme